MNVAVICYIDYQLWRNSSEKVWTFKQLLPWCDIAPAHLDWISYSCDEGMPNISDRIVVEKYSY